MSIMNRGLSWRAFIEDGLREHEGARALDGSEQDGRRITVSEARPKA